MFRKLISRGLAVMREWNSTEGQTQSSHMMLASLAAVTLKTLCGEEMKDWTPQEQKDKADALRIVLNSAFQVGRSSVAVKARSA